MTLAELKQIFSKNGCQTVYVKTLAANDNSKNQVYLGESLELVNVFSGVETPAAVRWSFVHLLQHWMKKHNKACYIPSMISKAEPKKYRYGETVMLGTGTQFELLLKQLAKTSIYYDPGIKMEMASSIRPAIKRRSQFRIKSGDLSSLYLKSEWIKLQRPRNGKHFNLSH